MIYKNPLSELTEQEVIIKYYLDIKQNKFTPVYSENNYENYLINFNPAQVDFIGGLWRVQNDFPYEIKKIGNQEIVIGDKILLEQGMPTFKYYESAKLGLNCYGFILGKFDCIAANAGKIWVYGKDINKINLELSGKGMESLIKNPFTRWIVKLAFARMK